MSQPGGAGRFAPSPTGAPHFGTLLAAVASYLEARSSGARWLLRIEDLDPGRTVPGAADQMLRTLEAHGLHWDGTPLYQSQRSEAYRTALQQLLVADLAFPCACTRRDLEHADMGIDTLVYPGTCRQGLNPGQQPHSYRVKVAPVEIVFTDGVYGLQRQSLAREVGDFVIRRGDGLFAYQLAVVVDDAFQGITQVVRGADLLPSTARQMYLQQLLGHASPRYAHIPLARDTEGRKLSKSEGAAALDPTNPRLNLVRALHALGQTATPDHASPAALLASALPGWKLPVAACP